MRLSDHQKEYIQNADARWNMKIGAVRSGKTWLDYQYIIPQRLREARDKPGLNVILGVSRDTIERNVLQPMRERYTGQIVGTINSRNTAIICGQEVYCLGAEKINQVAKIQGMSIKYCYGDEMAKWNPEVFAMLQSRLDKPYSKFDGSCNPEYPGHWLKQFIDRDDIDAYIQRYTIFDNPFLPEDFVENLCKEYAGTVYYGRYILGEWTLAEGLIYRNYLEAVSEPPETRPEKYVLSIDYGTQNPFSAGLWAKYGDVWWRVREYYYSGRDKGIQKTDAEYLDDLQRVFGDVGQLQVIIDPSAASFIALLRKAGYKVRKADNAVLDGIRETATAMHKGLIKISPECRDWIREAQGYVWDDSSSEDRPVKENDHAMDETRYFVKTMRVTQPKPAYVPLNAR